MKDCHRERVPLQGKPLLVWVPNELGRTLCHTVTDEALWRMSVLSRATDQCKGPVTIVDQDLPDLEFQATNITRGESLALARVYPFSASRIQSAFTFPQETP